MGHSGRRSSARRHRQHPRDTDRAGRLPIQQLCHSALQHLDQRLRAESRFSCRRRRRRGSTARSCAAYGLAFDGVNRFTTTRSINLGGITISRSVYINSNANWGRWLDSFTNTTRAPITIKVAFGGQSGIGTASGADPANSSAIVNTSSGDAIVTAADSWVEVATPLSGSTPVGGPQVTVLGTPDVAGRTFNGAMTFAGNWLFDTFNNPLSYSGHEANFQAYVNTITLQPGKTRSLLHFVVLGQMVTATSSAGVRAAVEATANSLASAPEISDLTLAEVCSIDNFNVAALTAGGFDVRRVHDEPRERAQGCAAARAGGAKAKTP